MLLEKKNYFSYEKEAFSSKNVIFITQRKDYIFLQRTPITLQKVTFLTKVAFLL
jgi:hypothetical protein